MADFAISSDLAVQAQLDRLSALSPGRDVLGLERITELCARLGNPQGSLPPVFHVAGTNGKGSTCAFLRGVIEAAGLTTHVYSSPHLVRFNERIRLAGTLIEDDALAAILSEVLDQAEGLQASFFEVTTAAAFLAFSRTPADACIIEVGLGGRLDATNIIKQPLVCGIASLGIDHEAFLLAPEDGVPDMPPLERIAFEKAGIAKRSVPLVTMDYAPAIAARIATVAEAVGAPIFAKGLYGGWAAKPGDADRHLVYGEDDDCYFHGPPPAMPGRHQINNAGLAIAMLRRQSTLQVSEEALKAGVANARWPARLQRLGQGPLTELLPEGTEIWLDGGHNVDAGLALAHHFDGDDKRIHLIIGMLANKDPSAIIAPVQERLASITALPVPGHEWHPASAFGENAAAAADVAAALRAIALDTGREIVLIAGSLYLAGEVLRLNGEMPV
ncbi:MAG: bifunctional folylpolyglutamate synthase/dihydrofolate synthase [Sphingomonadales bacterium]|nr:bifunctional folylpolyglutamate synthase/dihydrofolate synthase [Sphingomonadales bacterium]